MTACREALAERAPERPSDLACDLRPLQADVGEEALRHRREPPAHLDPLQPNGQKARHPKHTRENWCQGIHGFALRVCDEPTSGSDRF
jgi:hypothetical protein